MPKGAVRLDTVYYFTAACGASKGCALALGKEWHGIFRLNLERFRHHHQTIVEVEFKEPDTGLETPAIGEAIEAL
jgi:hypothetical protein